MTKFKFYECISKVTFTRNMSQKMANKLMEYKDQIHADTVRIEKQKKQ